MRGKAFLPVAAAFLLLLANARPAPPVPPALPDESGTSVYNVMGIAPADVLNGTVLSAPILSTGAKQLVALVTYLTGRKVEAEAVNVRLEVFRRVEGGLESVYSRDFGKENGGHVGRGNLETVDLDGSGGHEIIVSWDNGKDRLVAQRQGEVILHEGQGFRSVWSGLLEYDATRAARGVPADRRDRYVRVLDIPATLKTRGQSLVFEKRLLAVAGERLPEARVSREAFPMRAEAPSR